MTMKTKCGEAERSFTAQWTNPLIPVLQAKRETVSHNKLILMAYKSTICQSRDYFFAIFPFFY